LKHTHRTGFDAARNKINTRQLQLFAEKNQQDQTKQTSSLQNVMKREELETTQSEQRLQAARW
jgi:hypothetical protein